MEKAPEGTTRNDSCSSGVVSDATFSYFQDDTSQSTIDSIAERCPSSRVVSVDALKKPIPYPLSDAEWLPPLQLPATEETEDQSIEANDQYL